MLWASILYNCGSLLQIQRLTALQLFAADKYVEAHG